METSDALSLAGEEIEVAEEGVRGFRQADGRVIYLVTNELNPRANGLGDSIHILTASLPRAKEAWEHWGPRCLLIKDARRKGREYRTQHPEAEQSKWPE